MVTGPVSSHPISSNSSKKKKKVTPDTSSPDSVRGESKLFKDEMAISPAAAGGASGSTRDSANDTCVDENSADEVQGKEGLRDDRKRNDSVTLDDLEIARKSRIVANIIDQVMDSSEDRNACSSEDRNSRVERITKQIKDRTYRVTAEEVVENMAKNGELDIFTNSLEDPDEEATG